MAMAPAHRRRVYSSFGCDAIFPTLTRRKKTLRLIGQEEAVSQNIKPRNKREIATRIMAAAAGNSAVPEGQGISGGVGSSSKQFRHGVIGRKRAAAVTLLADISYCSRRV